MSSRLNFDQVREIAALAADFDEAWVKLIDLTKQVGGENSHVRIRQVGNLDLLTTKLLTDACNDLLSSYHGRDVSNSKIET